MGDVIHVKFAGPEPDAAAHRSYEQFRFACEKFLRHLAEIESSESETRP